MAERPPLSPTSLGPSPAAQLPLSEDERTAWDDRLKKARDVRERVKQWWDANLKAYAPRADGNPDEYGTHLNTNRDFTLVERKKADLFYQRPDVTLVPSPLMVGSEAILETHTTITNEALGPDAVNAKALVHQVLFDVLCPSGTGWTVMGYESATQDTETLDPLTQQPTQVPVPVYEACYWRWFSPNQALVPHDFKTTLWDEAPWLGYDFEIPLRTAKRKGWVDEDYTGGAPDPELHFDHGLEASSAGDTLCKGALIFYKSHLFRDDIIHPQHYTLLILIDGQDRAAEHKDSPYQTLDPQGRLTPDSLLGNPIHPLTIRTLSDSAYVPSDCTISRPIVNELNTFRRQQIEFRDAAIMRWMYNTDTLPTDALGKIVRSPIGGFIGVPGDAFVGEGAIKELPQGHIPRENFELNAILDNDLARTHGLDSNQVGAENEGDKTATETQIQQSNVNARLGFERGIVLDWYCKGVTKYSALIQRFYSVEQAARVVGPQAAQLWDAWRKQVPATLAFTALPDSALRNDLATERKRWRDEYSFFANDPFINRPALLKHLLPRLGYPQSVLNPQPPEKGPEPTKPGLSLKGEDLNPLMPQFPILVEVLAQCGIKISPQAIQAAQQASMNQLLMQQNAAMAAPTDGEGKPDTQHPGAVTPQESLNKHKSDETGGMQGSGAMAAMGPGGMVQ